MAVNIKIAEVSASSLSNRTHSKAKKPIIDLNQPGRLRVSHVLAILSISHSTLYAGLKTGRYPLPDGKDGSMPYWNTSSIRDFLATGKLDSFAISGPLAD